MHRAQRMSATPCVPQWEQLAALAAIVVVRRLTALAF